MNAPAPTRPVLPQEPSPIPAAQAWRLAFLNNILRVSLVLGALLLLSSFLTDTEPVLLWFYGTAFILLLISSLFPFPYQFKAVVFLIVLFTLGISGLLENGLRGDMRVWMVAFSVMSALLFGNLAGILANSISSVTLAVFGWLILSSRIAILTANIDLGSVNAWVVAILVNLGISALISTGIVWLENDFFNSQRVASSALDALREERIDLEKLVEQRTATVERRSARLQTASKLIRETSMQSDLDALLNRTATSVSNEFGYYHVGIFLFDESNENAVLRAASSEAGRGMLAGGHRLAIGVKGIVGATAYLNRPHISQDTEKDPNYFQNPDLPETHSELALPLQLAGRTFGVLDIHSREKDAFTQDDQQLFQILADQLALAVQNSLLIAESQGTVKRLEAVTLENVRTTWREKDRTARKAYRYTPSGLAPMDPHTIKSPSSVAGDELSIPIALQGQEIGAIELHKRGPATWNDSDRAMVNEISAQVALALENARLLEEAQSRAAQEQMLNAITAQVGRSLDINTILQTTLQELHQLPNVSEVSVYLAPQNQEPDQNHESVQE